LGLDSTDPSIWRNKAAAFRKLRRVREAQEAEARAAELEVAELEDEEDM